MESFDNHNTGTGAALEAGQSLALAEQKVQYLTDTNGANVSVPFLINGNGKAESLEHLLLKPLRHKGKPKLTDVASFIDYIKLYKTAGTLIFANINPKGGTFHAALDLAQPGETATSDHNAYFALIPTPDWAVWTENNKKWLSQEDFVQFVETQRHVFSEPSSATMLEIAMSIEASIKGNYKSAFRNANGDRTLVLDMSTDASYGQGEAKIGIPSEITIIIPPFEGQAAIQQSAFLRFRPGKEGVIFQYELQRPEESIRVSAQAARDQIASSTTLPVLNGNLAGV